MSDKLYGPCQWCGALAGAPCVTRSGKIYVYVHTCRKGSLIGEPPGFSALYPVEESGPGGDVGLDGGSPINETADE